MEIEDNRSDTSWVPAISILEEFIPKLDESYVKGIKKVILIDKDYHTNNVMKKANGRYIQIAGTKLSNIEMYFDRFTDLPDDAKKSRLYLSHTIMTTFIHELYHHRVRGQKRKRKQKFNKEQSDANKWARKVLDPIILERFPKEQYAPEWDSIQKKIEGHRWNNIKEIKNNLSISDVDI